MKPERRMEKNLSNRAKQIWEIVRNWEIGEVVNPLALGKALEQSQIEFIAFSCPASSKEKEDLEPDLMRSLFLERCKGEMQNLADVIMPIKPVRVTIILSDLEPRRTWGWQMPQSEITGMCRLMIEEKAMLLPPNWQVMLWSQVEARYGNNYTQLYNQVMQSAHARRLADEYRKSEIQLTRFRRSGKQEYVLGKVAQYAAEGQILRRVFPDAILVQCESNAPLVKDKMYYLLGESLPIIHPFM